jgi:hypothetical protein
LFDKPEAGMEPAREEERIALRCSRRELQFLDSFVVPLPDLVVPRRPEEREVVEAYAELVQDHAPVSSTLAELVRRGLRDGKVVEQLEATRSLVRASAERRSQAQQAAKSPEELQRQGFLGQ